MKSSRVAVTGMNIYFRKYSHTITHLFGGADRHHLIGSDGRVNLSSGEHIFEFALNERHSRTSAAHDDHVNVTRFELC